MNACRHCLRHGTRHCRTEEMVTCTMCYAYQCSECTTFVALERQSLRAVCIWCYNNHSHAFLHVVELSGENPWLKNTCRIQNSSGTENDVEARDFEYTPEGNEGENLWTSIHGRCSWW